MNLTNEQIKSALLGTVRVEEEEKALIPRRLTKEQEEVYRITDSTWYAKSLCSAGIRLSFKTNSRELYLRAYVFHKSGRKYYSFDLFVNGQPAGNLDNFSHLQLPADYTAVPMEQGDCEKLFSLGEGEKTVTLVFPYSVEVKLYEIALEDNSSFYPVKPQKLLLSYGDSITQGYDALRPSARYTSRLADALGAEELCKGIGGARFLPAIGELGDSVSPDIITVAYGTNDWSKISREEFGEKCTGFFSGLCKNYPDVPVFAISPLWRKDINDPPRKFGEFCEVERALRQCTKAHENVTVISGIDLIPHSENNFGDLRLHPNDRGFDHYFCNLWAELQKRI